MSQYIFGAGVMIAIPDKETPTPRMLGTLQETSIDFSGSIKDLFGQNQFAAATARGQQKITGKSKMAEVNADTYNDLYFNETVQAGQNLAKIHTEKKVDETAHTVTADGGTFLTDLGVLNYDGKTLTRVKETPKADEYSLNEATGLYTFNEALGGKTVYVSYLYNDAENGKTITINNQLMGEAPTFKGIFNGRFSGKQMTLILNTCVSSKLSLVSTKLEDFSIPEFDFSASANAAGRVGTLSTAE